MRCGFDMAQLKIYKIKLKMKIGSGSKLYKRKFHLLLLTWHPLHSTAIPSRRWWRLQAKIIELLVTWGALFICLWIDSNVNYVYKYRCTVIIIINSHHKKSESHLRNIYAYISMQSDVPFSFPFPQSTCFVHS